MGTNLFPNTPITKIDHILSVFSHFSKKMYYATVKMLTSELEKNGQNHNLEINSQLHI